MSDPNPSQEHQNSQPCHDNASTQSSHNSSPSTVDGETKKKVRKKPLPRAPCWAHFTKYKDEDGQSRAKCKYCETSYSMETSGSTTNLTRHLKMCLKVPKGNSSDLKQSELTFVKAEDGTTDISTWVFDQEAVRKALIQMIVVDELPFKLVEGEGFRFFLSVACPRFQIPSRYTIRRDCLALFNSVKKVMKKSFERGMCRVCLTTDTWTSLQRISYMVITAHWIDDEWKLQKKIISFCPISSHRGESIGQALEKCIEGWGIEDKVFTITVDNATANKTAIDYLRRKLNHRHACISNGRYMHLICSAHIINLIVQDGVKDASVSVDRVRAAVRYIRASPARLEKFKKFAIKERIDSKAALCLDVPTRWNSTYMMLGVAEKYEHAFDAYLSDDRNFFADLEDGYGAPTIVDWENVRRVVKVLQPFYSLTLKVSGSLHVTSNSLWDAMTDIHILLDEWTASGDLGIMSMAAKMRQKFTNYWGDPDTINFLVYLAVVLDPRRKECFFVFGLKLLFPTVHKEIKAMIDRELLSMFKEYQALSGTSILEGGASVPTTTTDSMAIDHQSDVMTGLVWEKFCATTEVVQGDKSELDKYLSEDLETNKTVSFDLLLWWKMNSQRFPILSRMARDVFSIPISTVASESAFSTGGRVLDSFRSSLTPLMVESLVCTQDWLRKSKDPIKLDESIEEEEGVVEDKEEEEEEFSRLPTVFEEEEEEEGGGGDI